MEKEQSDRAQTTTATTSSAAPLPPHDYGSRLLDDLGRLAADLRHVLLDETIGELPNGGRGRYDLARVREAVRHRVRELWMRGRDEAGHPTEGLRTDGEGTAETPARRPAGTRLSPADVRRVAAELTNVHAALGALIDDLRTVMNHGRRQGAGMMRGAISRARRLVRLRKTTDLFDGTDESFRNWRLVGWGNFDRSDERLDLAAAADRGLAYFTAGRFNDFVLKLQYRPMTPDFDMSAAVRFLDPEQPVPDRDEPRKLYSYDNQAYVAVHTGFEVLLGAARPGAKPGTFIGVASGDTEGFQRQPEQAEVRSDGWNDLEVEANGDQYTVRLNGKETARFTNVDAYRGRPADTHPHAGYIGVLLRKGRIALRHLRIETKAEARPVAEEQVR